MILAHPIVTALAIAATSAYATPRHNLPCSSDIFSPHSRQFSILNATYYHMGKLNVSGTLNSIPFCEINAAVRYGKNNTLLFALWLPDGEHYSDRFMAVGNGGMAGIIDYEGMLTQLNSGLGLSVAGGNAGHLASDNINDGPGSYLPYLHDKDEVNAWIHDAISLFTPAAKAMVSTYYRRRPHYSYYAGCSTGGAQGFALAQYHPTLFDGIYAGSPGNWYSHLALSFLWNAQHTNTTDSYLTQAELNFTTNAVLNACDGNDGVKDSLIENPLQCKFEISSLACSGTQNSTTPTNCLAPGKLRSLQAIYGGPNRSDTTSQLYPGFSLGSEIEWTLQEGPLADLFSIPILQNLVYGDLKYNGSTFNWASDVEAVDVNAGALIDEISSDLSTFQNHGGKLLTAQGWADPYNAATWPIEHLQQLETFFGGKVDDFYKLFMVPGGGHCGAATYYPSVPATYHVIPALIHWVENGTAPKEILTTDPPDGSTTTRKLCPWPATAKYLSGDVDNWESYTCR